jgi:small subunit ribosomal protein S8
VEKQFQEIIMAMSDPIADMLTRIRNGAKAEFAKVDIPGSKLKVELARVLKEQGYIKNYKFLEDEKQGVLRVYLKYAGEKKPAIYGLERVSKPGRRVYTKSKEVKPVLNGLGISILSTSKGLMTDKQAKKENVGGEVLCNIW